MARDNNSLDLRRSLSDLADLGVPHHALDRIVLRVAVAAVYLDRLDGGAHRQLGTEQLGHRRLFREWATILSQPSRMKHEMLSRFDLGGDVRELKLDPLKARDRLAELLSRIGVFERFLERTLGDAD